jgi:hypothetical protein
VQYEARCSLRPAVHQNVRMRKSMGPIPISTMKQIRERDAFENRYYYFIIKALEILPLDAITHARQWGTTTALAN